MAGNFLASAFTETPAAADSRQNFSISFANGAAARARSGRDAANAFTRFLQHASLFHSGPVYGKARTGGALVEQMFSRFMEGRDPTEFTLKEKTDFLVQGVLSGKIFEFAKPANVSLWKELSGSFARPEVKAKLAAQLDKVERTGAADISDGEHGRRATRVSLFQQIRSGTQQRKHGREHAGSQRHCTDPGDPDALHLRLSQSGALAQVAARQSLRN